MPHSTQSFLKRIFVYQKERFPLLVHIPLIAAFSFSAIGFSRACRGATDSFINGFDYLTCVLTNVILFFLLRVSDEHKDKKEDALYRSYLPVPRGLVSLKELSALASLLFIVATIINIVYYPSLLMLYIAMMFYLLLMRYEFFVPAWLKTHQVAYILSHMLIIPLADVYASSYDWKLDKTNAPLGLIFFFIVSFLNGIVLEVGRKLRVTETEEPGVVSYTNLWGLKTAPLVWLSVLTINLLFAVFAAQNANHSVSAFIALGTVYVLSAIPAVRFVQQPTARKAKVIEVMALVWALCMYLILGGIPMLMKIIFRDL
jgi:4-hydroxybenzoate polyprenyltransferase